MAREMLSPAAAAGVWNPDATRPAHAEPPPRGAPHRLLPAQVCAREGTMAEAMVDVATHLCCQGLRYEHQGRGPHAYDDLGLVRAAVQGALDWRAVLDGRRDAREPLYPDPIPDFGDYAPSTWQHNPNPLDARLRDWGLEDVTRHGGNVLKEARPGDVILFMGRGPRMGVVIAPWSSGEAWPHFTHPAVATVWEGEPPVASRRGRMSWTAIGLFRWPEAGR